MTETSTPEPGWEDALRALVVEAWAKRSPEEREAFAAPVDGIPPPTAPRPADPEPAAATWAPPDPAFALAPAAPAFVMPQVGRRPAPRTNRPQPAPLAPESIEPAIVRTERIAALSGAVVPGDLVADLSPALGRAVLERIAPRFDRTLVDPARNDWSWVLGVARRREILAGLDHAALADAHTDAARVPTDAAGNWLRACADGNPPAADTDTPLPELKAIVQALAWALPLGPALAPLLDDARHAVEVAGLLAGYDRMLAGGFIGRDDAARRLRAFVADLPRTTDQSAPIPILGVSGIGGAGKSTLLAHILRPLTRAALHDCHAPIVVALDFDRRSFVDGGELEWSFEVTRQIGLFTPVCNQSLADLRDRTRADRSSRGEDAKRMEAALESVHRDSAGFESEAGDLLAPAHLGERGLLLVLDTFEEWQRGAWDAWDRNAAAARVLEWVSRLSYFLRTRPGLVVSGRAPANVPGYDAAADPIRLDDLLHADATALLERLGVAPGQAGRLAKMVGGNPLSLKLAARHVLALPPERRADFARGEEAIPGELEGVLRQGLLYRRFLDHIPDAEVRKLAHPGLALRQVTPELIQAVLAGPCELGEVSPERARTLCERLEQEVWLVERQGDALVHRADIRRAMLRQMRDDPDQGPRVRAVHQAAARWFETTGADPVEAAYHLLALGEFSDSAGRPFEASTRQRLVGAFDDFDPDVRVILREQLGMRLTAADAKLLPKKMRRRWTSARCTDLVARGQPGGALRYWRKAGFEPDVTPWYIQAAFQAPDWETVVPYEHASLDGELGRGRLAYEYLLAFSRSDERLRQAELAAVNRFQEHQFGPLQDGPIVEIQLENAFFRAVAGGGVNGAALRGDSFALSASGLASIDVRRVAAVATVAADGPDGAAFDRLDARLLLAQAFRPSADWVDTLIAKVADNGGDPGPLVAFQDRLVRMRAAIPSPTTGELLRDHAEQFAAAFRAAFVVLPPVLTLIDMLGRRGDDPEWRVPIRETLADALDDPAAFEPFAVRASSLLDIVPVDLTPQVLIRTHLSAPRSMWLRLVEFVDRCGMLGKLLAVAPPGDPTLAVVTQAYDRWDKACLKFVNEPRPHSSSTNDRMEP